MWKIRSARLSSSASDMEAEGLLTEEGPLGPVRRRRLVLVFVSLASLQALRL